MRIPFTRWEFRARPATRPDAWDDYWFNVPSQETKTGLDMNEDTAMRYSAVWACVRVISEDLASLPLFVYRREGDAKSRRPDHPVYYLLHDSPNPEMTAMQFRECLQSHVLLWGNCYAEIQRNLRGQPIALWPLNPANMTIKRDSANELVYEYRLTDSGELRRFRKEDIFHIGGLGFNGLQGYSVISYQREAIALGVAAEEFGARFFKNDASPRIAIKHPGHLKPETAASIKKSWHEAYGGLSNAHRVAILEEAMTIEKIGISNEDAQFLESRKFQVNDIARIFRVPPHKIMDLERATFSNIEHQGISYVVDTIRPWCVRWEQAIDLRLLDQSGLFFAEHLVDGLLRGDIASRYTAYATARQWGWLSVNDIRRIENMDPIPNGDTYLEPLNMKEAGTETPTPAPLRLPEKPEEETPEEEDDDEAARALKLIRRKSNA